MAVGYDGRADTAEAVDKERQAIMSPPRRGT
jgi:hypothetical protein